MNINFYQANYKPLLLIPIALAIIGIFLVAVFPQVPFGMDLTGGTRLIFRTDKPIDATLLEKELRAKYSFDELRVISISGPAGNGTTLEFSSLKEFNQANSLLSEARKALKENNLELARQKAIDSINALNLFVKVDEIPADASEAVDAASDAVIKAKENLQLQLNALLKEKFALEEEPRSQLREIGAILGATFWNNALMVALTSITLITIIVFIFFREIIPSLAIILAAAFDVLIALAFMALLSIPLSLSSIPALLMLVGYSIDTDIMLTTRMLKRREGTPAERSFEAMKTGITMTSTALAAFAAMLLLSYLTQMLVIYQIAIVLFFGLLGDLISTWLMNAPVLLWYVEKKKVI